MSTDAFVQQALARCRVLLRRDRAGSLRETSPEIPVETLHALAGIGFEDREGGVRASVYVIAGADRQGDAADRIRRQLPDRPGMVSKIANNGPLLFFAHTTTDLTTGGGPNRIPPEDRLAEVATAFAGDE